MSLAESLLNTLSVNDESDDKTLVIDIYTRQILIPKEIPTLGVEYDNSALKLKFRVKRFIGDVDLYGSTTCINYVNAEGEDDKYDVNDLTIVGDNLEFTWEVGYTATAYKGKTKFSVCMRKYGEGSVITQEFNTTTVTLPVLEGLETGETIVEEYTDLLNQWRDQLFGIGDTEEAVIRAASEEEQENIRIEGGVVLASLPDDYTATVEKLDDTYRRKAEAVVFSESGEYIALDDSSENTLFGLNIKGKTTQFTTTGKNLLYNGSDSTFTNYGLTTTIHANESRITLNGTSSSEQYIIVYRDVPLDAGTYTISVYGLNKSASTNTDRLYISFAGNIPCDNVRVNEPQTFTLDQDSVISITAVIAEGSSYNNKTIETQIESGSTATSYEPYTGGKATPSPEYPQELTSVETPTVTVYGKNLIRHALSPGQHIVHGITFTVNQDKTVVANGTATNVATISFEKFDIVRPIRLTGCPLGGDTQTYRMTIDCYVDDVYKRSRFDLGEGCIIRPSDADYIRINIFINTGVTVNSLLFKPMITVEEFDTVYEPTSISHIATTRTLHGIPVSQNGDYTDSNGQQWVCDEIDFERKKFVQRVNMKTFDGSSSENWYLQYESSNPILEISPEYSKKSTAGYCSHYTHQHIISSSVSLGYSLTASASTIRFRPEDYATITLEEWKARLAESPISVMYALATPIEHDLTAAELQAYEALKTNYSNTTIFNDHNAMMTVKYGADIKTYIPKSTNITLPAANWVSTSDPNVKTQAIDIDVRKDSDVTLNVTPVHRASLTSLGVSVFAANENGVVTAYSIGTTISVDLNATITEQPVIHL